MSTPSVQNLEEAAAIASEFIATLENIPSEVQFLLQELRTKETQSQELQQEIAKDSHKFIRHALRSDLEATGKDKLSPPPPTEKIKQAQRMLTMLADEKIALAERIVELLSRKRSRLDYDLGRVLVLQGEPDAAAVVAGAAPLTSASGGGTSAGSGYVLGGRNPAAHINESLRNAFSGATLPASTAGSTVIAGGRTSGTEESANKKRKLTATQGSIKLPSPAPSSYAPASGRGRRKKRGVSSEVDDMDFDFGEETQAVEEGEGDEGEGEEGDDGDDKELYCVCQKLSYGEMIACDNPDCPFQWFHLPCVNLKQPLPENWFCADCTKRGMGPPTAIGVARKGRKK
ncbi:hypothetical protein JVT61DRAFT_13258 [Boletus reticuloceps]|uniref:Chromatin modification-related protein n=1 Tax=Boletus reticuloceps TaxID=495285 RepID=A0A8I2YUT6_9AGAM|nr:hypothetical protein JVT61DRAFT_13258 [Boletus reticuloceps]